MVPAQAVQGYDFKPEQRLYANLQNGCISFGRINTPNPDHALYGRDRIECFTESSRKRFGRYLKNAKARYRSFITLTYPPGYGISGRQCKRDLDAFIKRFRRFSSSKRNWSIVWWQEWQKNGRLHYHLLSTEYIHHNRIAGWWYDICGSKNRDHFKAGTEIRKIRGNPSQLSSYAVKYAVKSEQKQVPRGFSIPGRFWGVVGYRDTVVAAIRLSTLKLEDPDIAEAFDSLRKERDRLQRIGIIRRIELEKDDYQAILYVWDPDNVKIRELLMTHVERIIEEVSCYERTAGHICIK